MHTLKRISLVSHKLAECKQCQHVADARNYVNGHCVPCQLAELLGVNDKLLGE